MSTTLRTTVRTTLTGDATLASILTGGVLDASTLDLTGEGASETPKEADGITIKPHAVIRWRESGAYGFYPIGAEDQMVEVYFYHPNDYDQIDAAISRTKLLLHNQYFNTTNRQMAHFSLTHISRETPAPEMGMVPSQFVRFDVITIR